MMAEREQGAAEGGLGGLGFDNYLFVKSQSGISNGIELMSLYIDDKLNLILDPPLYNTYRDTGSHHGTLY